MSATSSSDLPFASWLAYSPRGTSAASLRSQRIVRAFKFNRKVTPKEGDAVTVAAYFAARLAEELPATPFAHWFDDAALVPVPRSAPLQRGALWPASQIASELVARGLGAHVATCLLRTAAVPKSAFCAPGERPGRSGTTTASRPRAPSRPGRGAWSSSTTSSPAGRRSSAPRCDSALRSTTSRSPRSPRCAPWGCNPRSTPSSLPAWG